MLLPDEGSTTKGYGGGVGGGVNELLGFFINHVFVGVFQYDSGTPKHALELKTGLIFFGFWPKELNFYGLELKVQEVKDRLPLVGKDY